MVYNEAYGENNTEDIAVKRHNYKIKLTAAALAALMLAGCTENAGSSVAEGTGSQSSVTENSVTESSAPENSVTQSSDEQSIDESALTEEQIYDNMVKRSLMDLGNLERMAKFIEKLESKQEVTVAFIGGSITEGLTAGPEKCWARLTYDWLCEQYPDTKINYVNAGMSGTPSILGNIRLKRDVLDYSPDMVFVEFAVNDGNEQTYKDSYEALVRTVLESEKQPAVALYFTVIESGHTCEAYMSEVGRAYSLPMVSLNNVLSYEFEKGRMTWQDYSDDQSHPNEWGHEMTKDLIVYMFEQAIEKTKEMENVTISELPTDWVYSDRFYGMEFVDDAHSSDNFRMITTGSLSGENDTIAQFPDGWSFKGQADEFEAMEFEFTGKNLMLVYKCANSKVLASAKITVDGKEAGTFATAANDGWNNPVAQLVYSGDEGTHTVKLEIAGKEGACYIEILGFGFC